MGEVPGLVFWTAQLGYLASGKRHLDLFVGHDKAHLRLLAMDCEVLKLPPVDRIWRGRLKSLDPMGLAVRIGDRNAEEDGDRILILAFRHVPAAVPNVAGLARAGVEQRSEPIRR